MQLFFLFQIGADGRRSQIYLALSTASEFRDHLSTFSDFYASLGTSQCLSIKIERIQVIAINCISNIHIYTYI